MGSVRLRVGLYFLLFLCMWASGLTQGTVPASCPSCVFGPQQYTRSTSTPRTETSAFAADPEADYLIDIDDVASQGADGSVTLNGIVALAPRAQMCAPGEVLWQNQHLTAPECTCADLPEFFSWLETAKIYRELYREIADDLRAKEAAGMSVSDSQAEYKRQENAKTGAVQAAQKTSGDFATTYTDLGQCYTCIGASHLTTKCRAFLEAVWVHEGVHRDACTSREKSRTSPFSLAGSVHATEEQISYAAQIPTLVKEIDRLLKKVQIEWTTNGTDYDEKGSAQLHSTVVASEALFNIKGSGSVTFNLKAPDAISAAIIPGKCKTTRGSPATVPVDEELGLKLDPPPASVVFTVHTDGTIVEHTFTCSGLPRPFKLPIGYVGAAYFFDYPIKDGSTAKSIMPPSPPGTAHTNFIAKLKCIP
jgi:hypothetical protein